MSPFGFGEVTIMTAISGIVDSLLRGGVIFVLILVTTSATLQLDVISILPIVVLGILSVLGLGMLFGAAAVRYKKIDSAINLLSVVFPAFIAAPVGQLPELKYLPLAQSSYLLQRVMEDGEHLWTFAPTELAILLGVGVVYSVAGYIGLVFLTRSARKNGVMGHY
jgi:ABC-2 type transport system permease protein